MRYHKRMPKLLIITQKVDQNDQLLGFFIDWLGEFAGRFERVSILCLEKGDFTLPGNAAVYSLGKDKGHGKLKQLFTFYKYCWNLRQEYDVVFVHMNPIWVILGWKTWFLFRKKVFLWYAHKQITFKLRTAEKLAAGIFTSTSEGFRLSSRKLHIVGQGINTEIFKPDLSKRKSRLSILSVGRIAPSKNLEVLIEAAKILKDEGLNFEITIIGESALARDRSYEHQIRNKVMEYGLGERLHFLGKVPHRELPIHYQSNQFFINTGTTGSLDKTIVEAMASGCVVISSNDAARKFLPKDLVLERNDPVELVKIIKVNNKTELRQELVDYVRANHSLGHLIDKISQSLGATSGYADFGEIYNRKVREEFGGQYEKHRWFKTPVARASYVMTAWSINRHFINRGLKFENCLEVGPGPGTWTKLILNQNPGANYDLVDISSEMLDSAKRNIANPNVKYFLADFMKFSSDKTYDLFFSSRAIEYFKDKIGMVRKIYNLTQTGTTGCIVTKTPHYLRARLRGKKYSNMHLDQISPPDMRVILAQAGFRNIEMYPATMVFPILKLPFLNKLLFLIFRNFELNPISRFFSESYIVIFRK